MERADGALLPTPHRASRRGRPPPVPIDQSQSKRPRPPSVAEHVRATPVVPHGPWIKKFCNWEYGPLHPALSRWPMLHAARRHAGEGTDEDVPAAGPTETMAKPWGGHAGHQSASACMCNHGHGLARAEAEDV